MLINKKTSFTSDRIIFFSNDYVLQFFDNISVPLVVQKKTLCKQRVNSVKIKKKKIECMSEMISYGTVDALFDTLGFPKSVSFFFYPVHRVNFTSCTLFTVSSLCRGAAG